MVFNVGTIVPRDTGHGTHPHSAAQRAVKLEKAKYLDIILYSKEQIQLENEGMKTVVDALFHSIPALSNVLLIVLLFVLVFAILGIMLLVG